MAQWKPPRKSDTSAADAKKRKNEDDQRGEAATTEGGGGGEVDGEVDAALGNRSIDVEVEKDVERISTRGTRRVRRCRHRKSVPITTEPS